MTYGCAGLIVLAREGHRRKFSEV
ncbi:MAG: hypothetical protein QOJ17_1505, partial [Rhodospirillaceae bacterium]|nr:hypothetical protein [Rhodospirillaceae bacterium]